MITGKLLMKDIHINRSGWLDLKSKTIGSSEIVTVCGRNKWKTPFRLWAEKTGKVKGDPMNPQMKFGQHNEPFIIELFAEKNKNIKAIQAHEIYAHNVYEWATASPDSYVMDVFDSDSPFNINDSFHDIHAVNECKTVGINSLHMWQDENVPDYAHMQLLWQMGILGLSHGYVSALVGGQVDNFFTKEFEFSEDVFIQMLELGQKFIEMLRADIPPAVEGSDKKLLFEMQRIDKDKEIQLQDHMRVSIERYRDLKLRLKEAEQTVNELKEQKNRYDAEFIQVMNGAGLGIIDGAPAVRISEVNKKEFTVKASKYFLVNVK